MALLFFQMSGTGGTGKSTIAARLGVRCGAVVLDIDVKKTQLLDSGTAWRDAGRMAYEQSWPAVDALLKQGTSVVMDSPCHYQRTLSEGQRLSRNHGATYVFVDCILRDHRELLRRLESRTEMRSQRPNFWTPPRDSPGSRIPRIAVRLLVRRAQARTLRPAGPYVTVDAARSVADVVEQILEFAEQLPAS